MEVNAFEVERIDALLVCGRPHRFELATNTFVANLRRRSPKQQKDVRKDTKAVARELEHKVSPCQAPGSEMRNAK